MGTGGELVASHQHRDESTRMRRSSRRFRFHGVLPHIIRSNEIRVVVPLCEHVVLVFREVTSSGLVVIVLGFVGWFGG